MDGPARWGEICRLLGQPPAKSELQVLRLVENGLPVDPARVLASYLETADIGAGAMADMVVPRMLARRRMGRQRLTRDESDRLVRVTRIVALAEEVFANRENALSWLWAPKPHLDGGSPMTALATETGARLVESMLHQLDRGIAG